MVLACVIHIYVFWWSLVYQTMQCRDDDFIFTDFISVSSIRSSSVNEDKVHQKMPDSVRNFLKKKFGTIARFYSGLTIVDTSDVNGFSRIKDLRRALSALDRGGWERSYHQKLFHVSFVISLSKHAIEKCILLL